MFVSKSLNREKMINFILDTDEFRDRPRTEIVDWIDRKYAKDHQEWVKEHFDNQYQYLLNSHRRHARAWKKYMNTNSTKGTTGAQ
jgi:hypothetical protein